MKQTMSENRNWSGREDLNLRPPRPERELFCNGNQYHATQYNTKSFLVNAFRRSLLFAVAWPGTLEP